MIWDVGNDDSPLEQQSALEKQSILIVQEILPPPRRNELRKNDRYDFAMRAALDAIDIVEQRPQKRAVWRRHYHEVDSRSPLLPLLAQLLGCLVIEVDVNRGHVMRRNRFGVLQRRDYSPM